MQFQDVPSQALHETEEAQSALLPWAYLPLSSGGARQSEHVQTLAEKVESVQLAASVHQWSNR
jgi:hypothetical protein